MSARCAVIVFTGFDFRLALLLGEAMQAAGFDALAIEADGGDMVMAFRGAERARGRRRDGAVLRGGSMGLIDWSRFHGTPPSLRARVRHADVFPRMRDASLGPEPELSLPGHDRIVAGVAEEEQDSSGVCSRRP